MSEIRETKIETSFVAVYKKHGFTDKGTVDIEFKLAPGELPEQIKNIQMINANIKTDIRFPDEDSETYLGVFTIKALNISGDGTSVIKLFSACEDVEVQVLDNLPFMEAGSLIRIDFTADVEYDDDEEEVAEEQETTSKVEYDDSWNDDEDDSWGDFDENNNDNWDD